MTRAKKKSVTASKEKESSDEVLIEKEDFINIAVAHREDQLTSRKAELERGFKKWDRRRRTLFEKLLQLTQTAVEQETLPLLHQAVEAMEKLGISSQAQVAVDTVSLYRDAYTDAEEQLDLVETGVKVKPSFLESPYGFYYSVSLMSKEGQFLSRRFSEFNKEQLAVYKEILAGDAAAELATKELAVTKKALKDVPRLERKAKAAFAVQALKTSNKGQAILKAMADLTSKELTLDFVDRGKPVLEQK